MLIDPHQDIDLGNHPQILWQSDTAAQDSTGLADVEVFEFGDSRHKKGRAEALPLVYIVQDQVVVMSLIAANDSA